MTETIFSGSIPTTTVDVTALDGHKYLISNVVDNGVTGATTAGATQADMAAIQTSALVNPNLLPTNVVYTITPYTNGPNGTDNDGSMDDCLGTPF